MKQQIDQAESAVKRGRSMSAKETALDFLARRPNTFFFPIAAGTKDGGLPLNWNTTGNTNNPAAIRKWPDDCNVGLALQKSGLVPADVDTKPGKRGAATFAILMLEHGQDAFPDTYTVETWSGGRHYYYEATGDVSARTAKQNAFGADIDLAPFLLVAGSLFNGKRYKVVNDAAVAPAPQWFAEYLKEPPKAERNTPTGDPVPLVQFKRMLAATPYEGRHNEEDCVRFLMAVHEAAGGESGDYAEAAWEWCNNDPNHDWTKPTSREWFDGKWDRFNDERDVAITRASWFKVLDAIGRTDVRQPTAEDDFSRDDDTFVESADMQQAREAWEAAEEMLGRVVKDHEQRPRFKPSPFADPDPKTIEPRDWLYALHYIRKFVVADVAPGGTVKTSNALVEAVVMASGADLLCVGDARLPRRPLKVWYWSGEDTKEEIDRRLSAVVKFYTRAADDEGELTLENYLKPNQRALLKTNLFTDTGRLVPIKIAVEDVQTGFRLARPIIDALIETINGFGIDVLIIDPFIDSHSLSENDNQRIEAVVAAWREIAERGKCCICLVHHTRKGKPGAARDFSADDARGATALVDAARDVRVFNVMSEEEAERYYVPKSNCWRYIRVDSGKPNMAARGDLTSWRYIDSVTLGNAREAAPGELRGNPGDSVGVALPWSPPVKDPLATEALQDAILAAARKLFDAGIRITYSHGRNRIVAMVESFRATPGLERVNKSDIEAALQGAVHGKPPTWGYSDGKTGGHGGAGYYPLDVS